MPEMIAKLHCRSVTLTPLSREHRDLYVSLYTDPEVMAHIASPLSAERANASFDAEFGAAARRGWVWVIAHDELPVGLMALRQSQEADLAEIGTMLKRSVRGRGIALNAIKLSIQFAFERNDWRAVVGRHQVKNLGADAVMRMTRLPFDRTVNETDGHVEWRLTRDQWRAAQLGASGASMDNAAKAGPAHV